MYKVPTFLGGAATPTTRLALSQGGQILKIEQISDFQISKSSSEVTIGEFWDCSGITLRLFKRGGAVADLADCKCDVKPRSMFGFKSFQQVIVEYMTSVR